MGRSLFDGSFFCKLCQRFALIFYASNSPPFSSSAGFMRWIILPPVLWLTHLLPTSPVWANDTTTNFSGVVPFYCSIANGGQVVTMTYNPSKSSSGQVVLEGEIEPLQLTGNGAARLDVQLSTISSHTPLKTWLFTSHSNTGLSIHQDGDLHYYNHNNNPTLSDSPTPVVMRLEATFGIQPAEHQLYAVLTCLDV